MERVIDKGYFKLIHDDCSNVLNYIKPNSIDLILTSPPYADARKHDYNSIKPEQYVEWFLGLSEKFYVVLKDTGSFIFNIKEKTKGVERMTFVYELVLELRKAGWLWVDEFIWHKKNPLPGKRKYRLKDGFERIYHFAKSDKFYINFDEVKQPVKASTLERRARLKEGIDDKRVYSSTNSGISFVRYKALSSDTALPSNVLYYASETKNVGHSAAFPIQIPEFFIKLLTKKDDIVLDPFCGSGTTIIAAVINNRKGIGIEIEKKYFELSYKRILENIYDKITKII